MFLLKKRLGSRRMYAKKFALAKQTAVSSFADQLINYIIGEVNITVPFTSSYKYHFGKFYKNHPRFTDLTDKTFYKNEYEKIYDITGILEQLRLIYPYYSIYYDDINGVIHVRAVA